MKLHYAGERGKAVCGNDGLTTTTFAYRDVPFSDCPGTVKDVLVAVCDTCGKIAAIPPQSTPAIKTARDKATVSIEANLPAVYLDALDLACFRIDSSVTQEFRKRLLIYYIHRVMRDKRASRRLFSAKPPKAFVEGEKANVRRRLSLKVSPSVSQEIDTLSEIGNVSRTDLFKSLVHQIDKDIISPKKPSNLSELQALAATTIS